MRVSGYTLTEVVVTLVVVAAAITIAAATMRGVARDADDQVATAQLTTVALAALDHYQAHGYLTNDVTRWTTQPSNIETVTEPTSNPGTVTVMLDAESNLLGLATFSERTGMCHFAAAGPTTPLTTLRPVPLSESGVCDPSEALAELVPD